MSWKGQKETMKTLYLQPVMVFRVGKPFATLHSLVEFQKVQK